MSLADVTNLTSDTAQALRGLLGASGLRPHDIVVVGCSSSEVAGHRIGSASSADIAEEIMGGLLPIIRENQLYLAIQCCEHLNRALVAAGMR